MSKGKLIIILGPPCSGKSTLASEVHVELKKRGLNSAFVSESASEYIAEYGIPNSPNDQMVIFYKQLNKEKMFLDSKDYIICDSSFILNYFYFRGLFPEVLSNKDISAINHIQKEILKNLSLYDTIYYVPPIIVDENDGIRFHQRDEIDRLDKCIKSYLWTEKINHIDLSNIDMSKRVSMIVKNIVG